MLALKSTLDIDHPAVQEAIGHADFIIFQRNVIFGAVWRAMDYWRALGKIVLVDLDDHYPAIPPSNPAFQFWQTNTPNLDPHPVEALKIGLGHADGLVAPSQVLLDDWKDIVPGFVWKNYPPQDSYKDLARKRRGDPDVILTYDRTNPEEPKLISTPRAGSEKDIVIGWGGSISHVDSFYYSGVIDGMIKLIEENPHVVFKFCGSEDRLGFLLNKIPKENFIRQPGVTPEDWPQVVATFDIGIAPMDMRVVGDNTGAGNDGYSYDERRSWLKLVEYVCAGVPFVATDCAPYKELGRLGKMIENGADNWYKALKSRADGIDHFRAEAEKNRKWAMKRLTQEANSERLIALYTKIGEEVQSKRGHRLPDVVYIKPEEEGEPVTAVPRYSGDPLETGRAEWTDKANEIVYNWYKGLDIVDGIDFGKVMEYQMLERVNKFYASKEEVAL